MEHITNIEQQDLALELFKSLITNELEYTYRGVFSQSITRNILALTESNLKTGDAPLTIKNRIYFIMTEGLQNITRHQDTIDKEISDKTGIFVIRRRNDNFYITTGNSIEKNKIPDLIGMLEKINSLNKSELKKYHIEILRSGSISEKGGAGLGLVDMARKSGNKLIYDFKPINNEYSFFYLSTQIPNIKIDKTLIDEDTKAQQLKLEENSLQNIKSLHTVLNEKNVLVNFKGVFNKDTVLNLLSIIKAQKDELALSFKVLNIMVEMLQNIIKHADSENSLVSSNLGIFLMNKANEKFVLTAGNYIHEEKIFSIKEQIDYVNSLDEDELDIQYSRTLLDFNVNDPIKTGLGFFDMRIKSEGKLVYNFKTMDDKYSFFTIQASVPIKKKS